MAVFADNTTYTIPGFTVADLKVLLKEWWLPKPIHIIRPRACSSGGQALGCLMQTSVGGTPQESVQKQAGDNIIEDEETDKGRYYLQRFPR